MNDYILHLFGICPCKLSHITLLQLIVYGGIPLISVCNIFTIIYNNIFNRRN